MSAQHSVLFFLICNFLLFFNLLYHLAYKKCLQPYRTTLYVLIFFTRLSEWSERITMLFRCTGRLMTSQITMSSAFASFPFLLFGFVFICIRSWKSWDFILCIWNLNSAYRLKMSAESRNVVSFCNADTFFIFFKKMNSTKKYFSNSFTPSHERDIGPNFFLLLTFFLSFF